MDRPTTWLRTGGACLAVSLIAALLLPNGESVIGDRTVFFLDSWIERAAFWIGLIFIAGYVLDRVFGPRQNQ